MQKRLVPTLIVCVVAALVLLGCAAGSADDLVASESQRLEMPAAAPVPAMEESKMAFGREQSAQNALPDSTSMDRKIIYTVSLDLIVADTEAAFQEIQSATEEIGGFVAQSNMWRQEEHPRGTMTVRVPVERLDEALEVFKGLAVDVESQSKDSQDVTEEYVDLEARLENEQRTERELQELLETRSERGRTADILEVHRELSQVRAQIEQIQGRMTYLDNLSAMATVQISLTPDALVQPVVVAGWRPQGTARNAIRMLLRSLQSLADAAIMFFLLILPILIVIAIPLVALFFLLRFVVRRIRRRRQARRQAGDGSQVRASA
jgi:hypothetical protein